MQKEANLYTFLFVCFKPWLHKENTKGSPKYLKRAWTQTFTESCTDFKVTAGRLN